MNVISSNQLKSFNPLSANPTKLQIVDKLFQCVWPFCEIGA